MSNIIAEALEQLETINDLLRWALSRFYEADLFYGHGTDNPWDEAVALVLQSIHLPMDVDQRVLSAKLTTTERKCLINLIQRRVEDRVPVPYLTNVAWFAGLPFFVDERVLIPRSPVAELIEEQFQPWFTEPPGRILDLCTGSACIAIACEAHMPESEVVASDLSNDALAVAERNVEQHQSSVTLIESDLFDAIPLQKFDLIISNPPYVSHQEMETLPEEYAHEPCLALETEDDGLKIAIAILRESADYLSDQGYLIMEVGNSQVQLAERFPKVPFTWLDFERGGHGVLLISAKDLRKHQQEFSSS